MKYTTIVVLCLFMANSVVIAGSSSSDKNLSKLPKTAQKMIKSNFSKKTVKKVTSKNKTYEVTLSDNIEITFDRDGEWTKVDCKKSSVPNGVVPSKIRDYVKKNDKDAKIRKIEKDRRNYKVTLSTGKTLTFDENYKITRGNNASRNSNPQRKSTSNSNTKKTK